MVYCSYATGHRKLLFLMKTGLEQPGEKVLLVQVKRKAFLKSSVMMVKLQCFCTKQTSVFGRRDAGMLYFV